MKIGHVKNIGFDPTGRERRERLEAIAECPKCGAEIGCWSETEAWTESRDGRWLHSEYGGAHGECETCRVLIAEQPDGRFYDYELGG